MTVYLSGPITGIPDYKNRFASAERAVKALGDIEVINPANQPDHPGWDWAQWIVHDLHLLRGADALIALPGSKQSIGARIERDFAKGRKIPVVDILDVPAWASTMKGWRKQA